MATMVRSAIIAEAIIRAERKGQAISLINAFNFILKKITRDYPVLRNILYSFTTVASQAFVTLPSDYRSWEQCFYDTYELDWMEPEDYAYWIRVFTDTASTPTKYTIFKDERKLYLYNKPDVAKSGYLYYAALHPNADSSLAFTSGGTYEIKQGDTVLGHTSNATLVVSFVRVTSGSWAGGDAAGTIVGVATGTFQAENLDVGTNLNVATIGGVATSADNFVHYLGEEADEVVVEGVAWKCLDLIKGKNVQEKLLTKDKKKDFEDLLADYAGVKGRRELRTGYRGF